MARSLCTAQDILVIMQSSKGSTCSIGVMSDKLINSESSGYNEIIVNAGEDGWDGGIIEYNSKPGVKVIEQIVDDMIDLKIGHSNKHKVVIDFCIR